MGNRATVTAAGIRIYTCIYGLRHIIRSIFNVHILLCLQSKGMQKKKDRHTIETWSYSLCGLEREIKPKKFTSTYRVKKEQSTNNLKISTPPINLTLY